MVGQGVEAPPRFGADEVRWGFRLEILERLRAARAISHLVDTMDRLGDTERQFGSHVSCCAITVVYRKTRAVPGVHLRLYAVLGRPPAEADIQRYFNVTPPTVHQMVLTLERLGLIRRTPGVARSIELLVEPESLPVSR